MNWYKLAQQIPEWVIPDFASKIDVGSFKLKKLEVLLTSSQTKTWMLSFKGKIYKDQYGWISARWEIHPVLENSGWFIESTLGFAPATSGTYANQKFEEFLREVKLSGSSKSSAFNVTLNILKALPNNMSPEKDVLSLVYKHGDDLNKARDFWRKAKKSNV